MLDGFAMLVSTLPTLRSADTDADEHRGEEQDKEANTPDDDHQCGAREKGAASAALVLKSL